MSALLMLAMCVGQAENAAEPATAWESCHTDYGEALRLTRQEKTRPLLVVFEDPSKEEGKLRQVSLKEQPSDEALLANYRLCRLDASSEAGQSMAEKFQAQSFPFVAILDRTGAVQLYRHAGSLDESQWKTTLTRYRKGERQVRRVSRAVRWVMPAYSGPICRT